MPEEKKVFEEFEKAFGIKAYEKLQQIFFKKDLRIGELIKSRDMWKARATSKGADNTACTKSVEDLIDVLRNKLIIGEPRTSGDINQVLDEVYEDWKEGVENEK